MQRGVATVAMLLAVACGALAGHPDYPRFEGSWLVHGRAVWLANCEACHGYGVAGAPIPMQPDDWRARLAQRRTTLYQHALEGFFGPDDTMMPARGGNEHLSDDEVRAAVDYMTTLAHSYIQQAENAQ